MHLAEWRQLTNDAPIEQAYDPGDFVCAFGCRSPEPGPGPDRAVADQGAREADSYPSTHVYPIAHAPATDGHPDPNKAAYDLCYTSGGSYAYQHGHTVRSVGVHGRAHSMRPCAD
jgi:hypothetical protein